MAGVIAGGLAACSSAAMDAASEVMRDAGATLQDAGDLLADAGSMLSAASDATIPDARAQQQPDTDEPTRVRTADTEPDQFFTGSVEAFSGSDRVRGPPCHPMVGYCGPGSSQCQGSTCGSARTTSSAEAPSATGPGTGTATDPTSELRRKARRSSSRRAAWPRAVRPRRQHMAALDPQLGADLQERSQTPCAGPCTCA